MGIPRTTFTPESGLAPGGGGNGAKAGPGRSLKSDGAPAPAPASDEAVRRATGYLEMAKSLVKSDKLEQARVWAQKAIDAAPDSPAATEARVLLAGPKP